MFIIGFCFFVLQYAVITLLILIAQIVSVVFSFIFYDKVRMKFNSQPMKMFEE